MSLYNMMHGVNPLAGTLLAMLDLKPDDIGRLRDCYLGSEDNGKDLHGELEIHIYTRMGGGNRNWHSDSDEGVPEGAGCECAGCKMMVLTHHPLYLRDEDDDFDCTYATYVFKVPEVFVEDLKQLVEMKPESVPASPEERFKDFMERMETKGSEDADVRRVTEALKPMFEEISKVSK